MRPKMPITLSTQAADAQNSTKAPAHQIPAGLDRIVLTGFMGAGKSSVGRLLAGQLGWAFLDLDAHLEARTGHSIPQLFALHGEAHFRRLESSALANALRRTRTIVALGGGAPEQTTNRLLLEQTPNTLVVFLDAPFPMLYDRCMLQTFATPEHERPLLASPVEAEVRFHARLPLYRRLARFTLDTSKLSPDEAARAVLLTLASE
jgi:shikimate kinase